MFGNGDGEVGGAGRIGLGELVAVVAGYGMAAFGVRAMAPWKEGIGILGMMFGVICFAWLGLAMSGPLVLAIRRVESGRLTGAERAWILIGSYCIGLACVVGALRIQLPLLASAVPIGVIVILWLVNLKRREASRSRWTRVAAVVVLATWPIAWGAFVGLSGSIG